MVELCSDTPEKFSRHLIINIPSYAFENNTTVGSFINRVMARPEVFYSSIVSTPFIECTRLIAYTYKQTVA